MQRRRIRNVRVSFIVVGSVLGAALLGACAGSGEEPLGSQQQATAASLVSGAIIADSMLGGESEVEVEWGGHKAKVKGSTRLVLQELTFQPDGHTGWHTHGGLVFVSIVSGSLTLYGSDDPLTGETYGPGTAFVDPGGAHVHIACNQGGEPALVRAQYVLPAGAALRIDAAAPGGAQPCP